MALLNVRSLSNKTFIINDFIQDNNLKCLLLCETWLGTDGSIALIEASPANFKFSFSSRVGKKGGGTASIYSTAFDANDFRLGEYSSFEYHAVFFTNLKMACITIYRPPKMSSSFLTEFSEFLSVLHTKYNRILIAGDFNIHIDNDTDPLAREFLNILNIMDFKQHVSQPTHNRGHTLDLVISYGLPLVVSAVVDPAISDHHAVYFEIPSFTLPEIPVRVVTKRYLSSEVVANFINSLNHHPPSILASSCDSMVDAFNDYLKKTLDEIAPPTTKKVRAKPPTPWKNEHTMALKRACRIAERTWRKNKTEINYQLLRVQLKSYNNALKQSRKDHFTKLISANKNNQRILFSTIDRLINPSTEMTSGSTTDSQCEIFADHFRSKIDRIRSAFITSNSTKALLSDPSMRCVETLDSFVPVDSVMLEHAISHVKATNCLTDPIPSSIFKTFYNVFAEQLLIIMNCSLKTGTFPSAFKTAVVKPLLKKSNLSSDNVDNFRPVSNLPFLSKILEKIVFNQLSDFINKHNILDKFQSGFRKNHSTETALLKIVNDLRRNLDSKKPSILVLLDLSAAFDTVDHQILLGRLRNRVGLSGSVLSWFTSYLTDRAFLVSMNTCSSKTYKITCGVPQGSILGPLLFNLYMLPLGEVIRRHGLDFHSYADDTQLYIGLSPDDPGPIDALMSCISDIKSWMAENFLQLNRDKTEVILIGPEALRENYLPKLHSLSFTPADQVKNLGVIFDSGLNFIPHIKHITKTGFFHLKNIARVRPFLSHENTETLMHAFISSRVDYCNALLTGLPKKQITHLQLLQNSAARVLTRTRKREHITPVLKSLHWLPVSFRIDFKVLLLIHKSLNGLGPSYISELLVPYRPSRALRSSNAGLLTVPKPRTKTYGEAAFSFYGPRMWNTLPEELRALENTDIFKKRLKTHLFNLAFN